MVQDVYNVRIWQQFRQVLTTSTCLMLNVLFLCFPMVTVFYKFGLKQEMLKVRLDTTIAVYLEWVQYDFS